MMVTYNCKNCDNQFDGHWHEEETRRLQFPQFKDLGRYEITKVCPECGHYNKGARNVDFDEDFHDHEGGEDEEFKEESFEVDE